MRALLIVNPHATSTTERRRDLLAHALAGELSLKVARTESRGHAAHLAAAAADSGVDVVVVHGGDGTVNEVANGLMYRGVRPDVPMLAVVPGGSTNVFARAMGVDADPTVATEQILEALATRHRARSPWAGPTTGTSPSTPGWAWTPRRSGRWRRRGTPAAPSRTAMHVRDRCAVLPRPIGAPRMSLELPGRDPIDDAHLVFVSNVDPWTYLGNQPIRTNPGTSPDRSGGLRPDQHGLPAALRASADHHRPDAGRSSTSSAPTTRPGRRCAAGSRSPFRWMAITWAKGPKSNSPLFLGRFG